MTWSFPGFVRPSCSRSLLWWYFSHSDWKTPSFLPASSLPSSPATVDSIIQAGRRHCPSSQTYCERESVAGDRPKRNALLLVRVAASGSNQRPFGSGRQTGRAIWRVGRFREFSLFLPAIMEKGNWLKEVDGPTVVFGGPFGLFLVNSQNVQQIS